MADWIELTDPVDGRSCGGCTLCCKVMSITELGKAQGAWCPHCDIGVGCHIYDTRPDECRTFMCLWLLDARFGPEWKPNKSRIVITTPRPNEMEFRCDPGFPAAWRKGPYYSRIIEIARAAQPHDGMVMVLVGKNTTVVTPEKEFPLGHVKEDERIVRQMAGQELVDVRVVKEADLAQG